MSAATSSIVSFRTATSLMAGHFFVDPFTKRCSVSGHLKLLIMVPIYPLDGVGTTIGHNFATCGPVTARSGSCIC